MGAGQDHVKRGAVFFDLHSRNPYRLDVLSASIRDGRGNVLNKRLFVVQTSIDGQFTVKQPTIFHDLTASESQADVPPDNGLPDRSEIEMCLLRDAWQPMLEETRKEREREVSIISRHIEISLGEIINRENLILADLVSLKEAGSAESGLDGRIKISEDKLIELDHRLQTRRSELERERQCSISDIHHIGRAWVLLHPDRDSPKIAPMVSDPEIERIAVEFVIRYEEAQGRVVESVESENRGFDLISRKPHPEDSKSAVDVRFIEVKGRAHTGEIALTANEYKTAQRLGRDYLLYVVFQCATPKPSLNILEDPARLDWQPVVKVEHYRLRQDSVAHPIELKEDPVPYRTEG
jgi:Protein NO VEIN, C-terminal